VFKSYVLRWKDAFDTPVYGSRYGLNTSRWRSDTGTNWGPTYNAQYYGDLNDSYANCFWSGGNMVIEARKQTRGNSANTSARVTSVPRYSYGAVQVVAKLDALQSGVWPGIWLLGYPEASWPSCGELDMMEWFGDSSDSHGYSALHSNPTTKNNIDSGAPVTQYNIYWVEWRSNFIEFKVNGIRRAYYTPSTFGSGFSNFAAPQKLILNIALNTGQISWMPRVASSFVRARLYVSRVDWFY
jgi:beta-glucanase (GH16 family)